MVTRRSYPALFLAMALACLGCGGQSKGEPAAGGAAPVTEPNVGGDGSPDTTVPSPDPKVAMSGCLEVQTLYGGKQYTRKSWDAERRILKAELAASESFADVATLEWRYREDGQIIAYIGVEQPFQHDYAYDEHDNPIDFYLSYPEQPDLMHPSAAMPWIGRTYTNVYDDAGRLQQATQAAYGNGAGGMPGSVRHFSEDSQGRCSTITEDDGGKTVITYDGAGRVATIAASHPTWQRCSVSNA